MINNLQHFASSIFFAFFVFVAKHRFFVSVFLLVAFEMTRKKISSKKSNVNNEQQNVTSQSKKRFRYVWSTKKKNVMLNVLKKSLKLNDVRADSDLKSSMISLIFNVIAAFIISSNVFQMKNKYNDFKKNWKNWNRMLKLSEFDKDSDEEMTAETTT